MKTHLKLLALFLMLLMVVQSTVVTAFAFIPVEIDTGIHQAAGQPSKYSSQYNSGQRDVVATTLSGTSADAYYSGSYEYDVLSEKSSTEIKNALSTLMKSTHSYISSYDDCHYKANRTDCQNEDGSVSLIYTSYSATMSQWNGWNREHVWPKSKGGNNTTGGGADMHHIRPSDAVVNSTRGNKSYGYANGGKATYGSNPASGVLGGYSSTYFEPLDNVKGDVARIVLYVWVRWGSAWGADSVTEVFQSVNVLLEWCALDPVDTWELGRNEVIEDIQGNRNVFIDYPEYAWLIFGQEVPTDMVTPSGEAQSNGHHWDNGVVTKEATCTTNGIITYTCTDSGCGKTKTETIAVLGHVWDNGSITTNATCTATGIKTYTCSRCKATKTNTLSALGHKYGDWVIDLEATETAEGSKHRTCSVCQNIENQTIPLIGHEHSYVSVVTPPSCVEKGYTTHTCSTCGDKYVDSYRDMLDHSFSNGLCSNCGATDPNAPPSTKEDFSNILTYLLAGRYEGKEKYNKICEALNIYNHLSDADKKSVSGKYSTLKTIAAQYNEEIETINDDASVLETSYTAQVTILEAVSISAVSFAAYTMLNKKYY